MARGAGQKGKLLALERIFWEQTDEAHPLSIPPAGGAPGPPETPDSLPESP